MSGYPKVLWRDRLAHWLCSWVLRHVASKHYMAFIEVVARLGVRNLPDEVDEVAAWRAAAEDAVARGVRDGRARTSRFPYPGSRP